MSTVAWLAILIPVNIVSYLINSWSFRHPDWGYYWFGAWMLTAMGFTAWSFAKGEWSNFWWSLVCAVLNFIYWWMCRKRRKRKRATELAGYKARALQEKIAAKQRETAQHRPVLNPLPEGQ